MSSSGSVNQPGSSLVIIGPDVISTSAESTTSIPIENVSANYNAGNLDHSTDSYPSSESIADDPEQDLVSGDEYESDEEFEEDFRKRILNSPDDDSIMSIKYPVKIRTNKLSSGSFKDVYVKIRLGNPHEHNDPTKQNHTGTTRSNRHGKPEKHQDGNYSLGEYQHSQNNELIEYQRYGLKVDKTKKIKPDSSGVYPVTFSDYDFHYGFKRDADGNLLKDSDACVKVTKYEGYTVKCENTSDLIELKMSVKYRDVKILFVGDEVQLWEPSFYQGNFRDINIEDTTLSREEYEEVALINQYLAKNYKNLLREGYIKFTVKNDVPIDIGSHSRIALRTTILPPPKDDSLYVKEFVSPYTYSVSVEPEAIREIFYSGVWGNPDRNVMNQVDIIFGPILKVIKKSPVSLNIAAPIGGVKRNTNTLPVNTTSFGDDVNGEYSNDEQLIGNPITSTATVLQAAGKATIRFVPVVFSKGSKLVSTGAGKVSALVSKGTGKITGAASKGGSKATGVADKAKAKPDNFGQFLLKNPALITLGGAGVTAAGLTTATAIQVTSDSKKMKSFK